MPELDMDSYAHNLMEDVRTQAEVDGCGLHGAFTQLMLEQFCADGHAEDAVPVNYREPGVEVSGYGASSDDRCLDLFVTRYSPRADDDHKVDRATSRRPSGGWRPSSNNVWPGRSTSVTPVPTSRACAV
jgi:hypothetical protein